MGNIFILCSFVWINYKGLHDFEKRMIISKLLGGGCSPPPVATALRCMVKRACVATDGGYYSRSYIDLYLKYSVYNIYCYTKDKKKL